MKDKPLYNSGNHKVNNINQQSSTGNRNDAGDQQQQLQQSNIWSSLEFSGERQAANGSVISGGDKISFKALGRYGSFTPNAGCRNKIFDPNRKRLSYGSTEGVGHTGRGFDPEAGDDDDRVPSVSDIIGSFGWFQFLVLLFSGLREGGVGYDAVVMSIILQPESNFLCADNLAPGTSLAHVVFDGSDPFNETAQCFQWHDKQMFTDNQTGEPIRCQSWIFADAAYGASLVAEWSLVCSNHWLVAFVESAYFFGLVAGNLVWGFYADRVGRRRAYLVAHTVALLFGWASVFTSNIAFFCVCRFFSAFGSIGYNIVYSIQVELIGTKHRAFSTTLNHLGWGLGVICVPLVDHLFSNYRYIIGVAPMVALIMYPWAFWLPESSRWLMANEKFSRARTELIRAAKFNGKPLCPSLEKKISMLEQKIRNDKMKQQQAAANSNEPAKKPLQLLYKNPRLVRDTLILAYVSFTGHLFYYMLTINFSYMKNLSVEANFITSGAGEWVSVVVGAILLRFCSRKTCMSLFLLLMAASFGLQGLIDSGLTPSLDTPLIVTLNNGIGTLSGLLLIFVALIVNQEVFPTLIRQTGSSMVNTLGESGSTLAPLLIQMARLAGPWKGDIVNAAICLFGMFAVQFITKTDDIELPDT